VSDIDYEEPAMSGGYTQRSAWVNYRSRMEETISFLHENLEDAEDDIARGRIRSLIDRHTGYLRRAEERLAELSGETAAGTARPPSRAAEPLSRQQPFKPAVPRIGPTLVGSALCADVSAG
jgi:hypothetical protein